MKKIKCFISLVLITLLSGCNKYYKTSNDLINSCALEPEESWIYGLWEYPDNNSQVLFTHDGMKSSDLHKWLWKHYFGIQTTLDIKDVELMPYEIRSAEGWTWIRVVTPDELLYEHTEIDIYLKGKKIGYWEDYDYKNDNEPIEPLYFNKQNSKTDYRNGEKSIGILFEGYWKCDNNNSTNPLNKVKYIEVEEGVMTVYDRSLNVLGKSPITTYKDVNDNNCYAMGVFFEEHEGLYDEILKGFDFAVALSRQIGSNEILLYEDGCATAKFYKIGNLSDSKQSIFENEYRINKEIEQKEQDEYLTNRIIAKGTYERYSSEIDVSYLVATGREVYAQYIDSYSFKSGGRGTVRLYKRELYGRTLISSDDFRWNVKNGRIYTHEADGEFDYIIIDDGEALEDEHTKYRYD